eukprot:COSAG02_NODE_7444_length_3010_cov_9.551013_5_plen_213_part_01
MIVSFLDSVIDLNACILASRIVDILYCRIWLSGDYYPSANTTKPLCRQHKTPLPAFPKKPSAGARGRVAAHPRRVSETGVSRGWAATAVFCTFLRQSILNGSRALDFKRRYCHYFAVPSHRGPPGGARARAAAGRAHAAPCPGECDSLVRRARAALGGPGAHTPHCPGECDSLVRRARAALGGQHRSSKPSVRHPRFIHGSQSDNDGEWWLST